MKSRSPMNFSPVCCGQKQNGQSTSSTRGTNLDLDANRVGRRLRDRRYDGMMPTLSGNYGNNGVQQRAGARVRY